MYGSGSNVSLRKSPLIMTSLNATPHSQYINSNAKKHRTLLHNKTSNTRQEYFMQPDKNRVVWRTVSHISLGNAKTKSVGGRNHLTDLVLSGAVREPPPAAPDNAPALLASAARRLPLCHSPPMFCCLYCALMISMSSSWK